VKYPCFISSRNRVQKLISFLCVAPEKLQRAEPILFVSLASFNSLGTQLAHNFLYPNFSVTAARIVVLDTSGMMRYNSLIAFAPRIWRDFGSALPFQTRLTQIKPVLQLSKEHGSQLKDQGRRQCCHNKHKNFPIDLHVMYLYFSDTPRIFHTVPRFTSKYLNLHAVTVTIITIKGSYYTLFKKLKKRQVK